MTDYEVSYTAKDLILYALSLGMGSQKDDTDDLKFLYEEHEKFTAVPTFCFAFTFWAKKQRRYSSMGTTTQQIPKFPPPIMVEAEIIPRKFLRNNTDISTNPVIHTWQSIVWHRSIEIPKQQSNHPVKSILNQSTISIQPKSIGTFVTSETKIASHDSGRLSCTIQSTALVLSVDPANVVAFDAGIPRLTCISKRVKQATTKPPLFQWVYQTSQSQALLYRLTSGDSNHIHVDTSASEMLGAEKKAPLLHGLFTLALAFRAITKLFDGNQDLFFRKLEGAFKSPAFVGDNLCVKVWNDESTTAKQSGNESLKRFLFVIVNNETGAKVVDKGHAEVEIVSKLQSTKTRSRL